MVYNKRYGFSRLEKGCTPYLCVYYSFDYKAIAHFSDLKQKIHSFDPVSHP